MTAPQAVSDSIFDPIVRPVKTAVGALTGVMQQVMHICDRKDPKVNQVSLLAEEVIAEKAQLIEETWKNDKWSPSNVAMLGGGFFASIYFVAETVKGIFPALSEGLSIASFTALPTGLLTFHVGLKCFTGALQALRNNNIAQFVRLAFSGTVAIAIGLVLTAASPFGLEIIPFSLALSYGIQAAKSLKNGNTKEALEHLAKAILAAAVGAVLVSVSMAAVVSLIQLMPISVLVALGALPLLIEIGGRLIKIGLKKDLASNLKLPEIKQELLKENTDWEEIEQLFNGKDHPFDMQVIQQNLNESEPDKKFVKLVLSNKMEKLQAGMGPKAAFVAFKLFKSLLDKDKALALEQIEEANKEIKAWNRAQVVRLLQQSMSMLAFSLGLYTRDMAATNPSLAMYKIFENAAISLLCISGLLMDWFWPFKRNTTLIVPKVEVKLDEAPAKSQKIFQEVFA